jgi:hypothetical protein
MDTRADEYDQCFRHLQANSGKKKLYNKPQQLSHTLFRVIYSYSPTFRRYNLFSSEIVIK